VDTSLKDFKSTRGVVRNRDGRIDEECLGYSHRWNRYSGWVVLCLLDERYGW
jgi:hypothetical protein